MRWWEEKKGTHLTNLCVREREKERELLECSRVDEEKKRKKKSEESSSGVDEEKKRKKKKVK